MKLIDRHRSEEATHHLMCSATSKGVSNEYHMKCLPVKKMDDGRVKVIVFGERANSRADCKKRIRYVNEDRLTPLTKVGKRLEELKGKGAL